MKRNLNLLFLCSIAIAFPLQAQLKPVDMRPIIIENQNPYQMPGINNPVLIPTFSEPHHIITGNDKHSSSVRMSGHLDASGPHEDTGTEKDRYFMRTW